MNQEALVSVSDFENHVDEKFKIKDGSWSNAIAWILYFAVLLDAVSIVRGSGSLSLIVLQKMLGFEGPKLTATLWAVGIFVVQLVILVLATQSLYASSWRHWLNPYLREHAPGLSLVRLKDGAGRLQAGQFAVARDLLAFVVSVLLLLPLYRSFAAIPGSNAFFAGLGVAVMAYGATVVICAVLGNVQRDRGALIGLIGGAALVAWAGFYSSQRVLAARFTDVGIAEFSHYQAATIAVGLIAFVLGALRISDDLVVLKISPSTTTDLLVNLPELRQARYWPFQFRIETQENMKVALLSRDGRDDLNFTINSTDDSHDPVGRLWTILNLSALEKAFRAGSAQGRITHVEPGLSGYLECEMSFVLTAVTPESYLNSVKESRPKVQVQDLHNLKDRLDKGGGYLEFLSPFYAALGDAAGVVLDEVFIQGKAKADLQAVSLQSLRVLSAEFDIEANKVIAVINREYSLVEASAAPTLTNLDPREQYIRAVASAHDAVADEVALFSKKFNEIQAYDTSKTGARLEIKPRLEQVVKDAMTRLANRNATDTDGLKLTLLSFIDVQLETVSVRLTAEAAEMHRAIEQAHREVMQHWTTSQAQASAARQKVDGDTTPGIMSAIASSSRGQNVLAQQLQGVVSHKQAKLRGDGAKTSLLPDAQSGEDDGEPEDDGYPRD